VSDGYVRGVDRNEEVLLPARVEDYISADNLVRVIDVFVDGMSRGGEDGALPELREMDSKGGRRSYDPRIMAKLFIWGYLRRERSSRRLEYACGDRMEVIWLLGNLRPDHSSISRFRADHAKLIKTWLREFNLIAAQAGLFGGEELAVDGALLKAVNSKGRNFTSNKIKKMLEKCDERIERYLAALETNDAEDDAQSLEMTELHEKIQRVKDLQAKYEALRKKAKSSPTGQVSLTDEEAVLMQKKATPGSAVVGYNAQSAVDEAYHMIAAVEVSNATHDKGQLASMVKAGFDGMGRKLPSEQADDKEQDEQPRGGLRVLADAGYKDFSDIAATEALGVAPYVMLSSGRSKMATHFTREEFRYDHKGDYYECPAKGKLLRHADNKERNGSMSQTYYDVKLCKECPMRERCTKGSYRKLKRHQDQDSIDRMKLRMAANPEIYKRRAALVEHPFGTMLFWENARALLCRGQHKARAEFTLSALSYNIKRAANVMGVAELIRVIKAHQVERAAA
jgi:transposase